MQNRRVLVIGASGVLGAELASQMTKLGAQVQGTASSVATVSALPASLTKSYFLDLSDSASIAQFADHFKAENQSIDGVILASGLVAFGNFESTPAAVTEKLMQVNFLGQVQVVQKLLSLLTEAKANGADPFIVSISGVIAESPMAGLSAYSASKSALHAFSQASARELRRSGIRWIDARPGHTETGLSSRAIFGSAPAFGNGLEAQAVAARIIRAIETDERDLPSGGFN